MPYLVLIALDRDQGVSDAIGSVNSFRFQRSVTCRDFIILFVIKMCINYLLCNTCII